MERREIRIEVIDDATADRLRRMTPAQRVQRGLAMGSFARMIIEANVKSRHPDWDANAVRCEVARRFAGD